MTENNKTSEEQVTISKEALLSFLRKIPEDVLKETCKKVERENTEEEKTSKNVNPCNVVLLVAVIILLVLAGCFTPFDHPLPLDYEYSWVVFTLISMLSLQYVDFSNRLKNLFRGGKLVRNNSKEKAKKASFLLQWTGLFLIITIFALAIRIIWLSFSPEKVAALNVFIKGLEGLKGQEAVEIGKVFLFCDRVIIASFILGSLLRIAVFIQSYFGDLIRRWPWKCK